MLILDQSSASMDTSVTRSDSELDRKGDSHVLDKPYNGTCCPRSFYCSVQYQRENWTEHKFACSVVASKRTLISTTL